MKILVLFLLVLAAPPGRAQMNCQAAYPIQATSTDKQADLSGAFDLFKGSLGGKIPPVAAQAQAKASVTQHDVLSKYPNADAVALRQQELSYACQILDKDKSLTSAQKVALIQAVGEGIKIPGTGTTVKRPPQAGPPAAPAVAPPPPQTQSPMPSPGGQGGVQTCIGNVLSPCGPNYGTQTFGNVPPPERILLKDPAMRAVEILKTASKGSVVSFSVIGDQTQEIVNFANQVGALFVKGDWQWGGPVYTAHQVIGGPAKAPNGEGFGCSIGNAQSGAGLIAERALAAAGFPCEHEAVAKNNYQQTIPPVGDPRPLFPPPTDLFISIGTRIYPPQ